jgi:hypothetical protein
MESLTVIVQTFIKTDTLKELFASLLNCFLIEHVRLILWCDNPKGSRKEAEHSLLQPKVMRLLREFSACSGKAFRSVEIHENSQNFGTCKTCEIAFDYAFIDSDFVIFVEDDVIFARDALAWFLGIRDSGILRKELYWAVAGESIFFDARNNKVQSALINEAIEIATTQDLVDQYTFHKFVPSTCFATTREKWQEFGKTRGQPTGDVDVCRRCEIEDKFCIFPIIPRVKDTGMLHDLGYSVMLHSKQGVVEHNKQTYLLSDMISRTMDLSSVMFREFKGDSGKLYRQSTLLEGFGTGVV